MGQDDHWIPEDEWPRLIRRVRTVQTDMAEDAMLRFAESNLDHLRALIRLTIEFHYYLQSQRSAPPPREKFILNYVCESVFGGIESFQHVNGDYCGLTAATNSRVDWKNMSATSVNAEFFGVFDQFSAATTFENKCRLLLDLFRLQIVFAGLYYD